MAERVEITLARALKLKNRLAGRLAKHRTPIVIDAALLREIEATPPPPGA